MSEKKTVSVRELDEMALLGHPEIETSKEKPILICEEGKGDFEGKLSILSYHKSIREAKDRVKEIIEAREKSPFKYISVPDPETGEPIPPTPDSFLILEVEDRLVEKKA